MTEVEAWQSLHPQPGIPFPQSFIQQQQAPSFVHAAAFGAPQQPPQQQQQRQPFAAHAPFVQDPHHLANNLHQQQQQQQQQAQFLNVNPGAPTLGGNMFNGPVAMMHAAPSSVVAPPPQQHMPATAAPPMQISMNNKEIYDLTASPSPSPAPAPALPAPVAAVLPVAVKSPTKAISRTSPSRPPPPERTYPLNPFAGLGTVRPAPPRKSSFRVIAAPRVKQSPIPLPTAADAARIPNGSDSSSISRRPVQRSAAAKGYMDDIRFQLTPTQLNNNKPGIIMKPLRRRRNEDDGSWGPPLFSPSPEELGQIFQQLFEKASESYLRILADKYMYTEQIVWWVRMFRKEPDAWEPAIGPLIWMLSRTDMPVNYLQEFKFGGKIKGLVEQCEEMKLRTYPNIKKAYDRYHRYVQQVLLPKMRRVEEPKKEQPSNDDKIAKKRPAEDDQDAAKKRKVEAPPSKPAPKPAASTSVKPTTSASVKPAARTDMSFFNMGPKPTKAPLPTFTKRPAPPPPPPPAAAKPAVPSLLASTLKALREEESPPVKSPRDEKPVTPALPLNIPKPSAPKPNKKGHRVKWVDETASPPREFVAVRLFKQELHEFEPAPWQEDGDIHGMSAHALDRQEGAAMRHHNGVEEETDWYEPPPYDAPREDLQPTPEAQEQEQRERALLAAPYVPGVTLQTGDDQGVRIVRQDPNTRMMNTNPTYRVAVIPPPAPVQATVTDLLNNLNGLNLPNLGAKPAAQPPYGAPSGGYGQYGQSASPYGQNQGYTPTQGYDSGAGYNPSGGYGGQASNSYANPTGQGYNGGSNYNYRDNAAGYNANNNPAANAGNNRWGNQNRWGNSRGRGGHHGGGGGFQQPYRRKPCKFWRNGNCHEGDQCRFIHE